MIALDATMKALRAKGVECQETGWNVKTIHDFKPDLCHLFHCNFDWSWGNYEAVTSELFTDWDTREVSFPYVLTPVWYPGIYSGVTKEQVTEMVLGAKLILPFSKCEAKEMRDELGWFPFEAIPNGTDEAFHCTVPVDQREGVLCVSARGETDKNIPLVRDICKDLGIPFTCATGIPHEDMPEVYKRHRVFVNASESERMSLTVGEALCAGCRVISTDGNRGNEWYGPDLRFELLVRSNKWFGETRMAKRLREAIVHCYELRTNTEAEEANEEARKLTWSFVADRLIEVYRWAKG